ncbi:LuxR family transcriptional regulator [Dactylosporangium sp. NBC_01737]|uniref:helix-turn-helix transcriptional regulator n=1 Tax=Dactylosporangium sp. NBC_01737 TaxID=2975959 RepID=UPI002E136C20|nr:LuxR family transcriptional regulator [Dactylosporangium sp. NBC_01737]
MGRRRRGVPGRSDAHATLDAALQAAGDQGRLVLVRGPRGIGKSTLLTGIGEEWRRNGVRVVETSLAGSGDDMGFAGLVRAVRDHFERIGDAHVVDATSRLAAAVAARETADDGSPEPLVRATDALARLSRTLRDGGPTALVVDEADAIAAPTLALSTFARAGCVVVAAVTTGAQPRTRALARAADTVVDLPPLSARAAGEVIGERFGGVVNDGLLDALWAALGDLAGHPPTVLSTMDYLDRRDRIVRVGQGRRQHLCLRDSDNSIELAPDHPLAVRIRTGGPVAGRLAGAATVLPLRVDDLPLLAEATLGDVDAYGRVLDDLVAAGALVVQQGLVAPVCPALGARIAHDHGAKSLGRLHRAFAAALLRRIGRGEQTDPALLADHLTAAGATMPPDGRMAASLAAVAHATQHRDPQRAARWLRAALRHAGGGPDAEQILDQLLPVLVRAGRYGWLAEAVGIAGFRRCLPSHTYSDLASAALLAAVHTGTPVTPEVGQALRDAVPNRVDALDLADWWLHPVGPPPLSTSDPRPPAEGTLLAPAEFAALRTALRLPVKHDGTGAPAVLDDEVLLAASLGDLVAVVGHLLGPRYGPPPDGPLATHHRLVTAFRRGDSATVLTLARQMELAEPPGSAAHAVARALAAEVHGQRGEAALVEQSLSGVVATPPFLGLRWWVTAGTGAIYDQPSLLHDGLRALHSAPGGGLGVELSLARMAEIAAWTTDAHAPRVLEHALTASRDHGYLLSEDLGLIVRSVLEAEPALAQAAAGRARDRDDRPTLVSACLVAAGVSVQTNADPAQCLRQAHAAAATGAHGAPRIGALLRAHGLRPARQRAGQPSVSAVETQIIELIRDGHTNRQIAARIRMSEKTVETYLTRLYSRTGCRSRVELATVHLPLGSRE